jgi:DNA-3-methyladenine glycosylase II
VTIPLKLTQELLETAAYELAQRDNDLADIFRRIGAPPLWARPAGFATLLHIILEQQVSLASAKAAFRRLETALGETPTPEKFLTLSEGELKAIGFSRQKTAYARYLAQALLEGRVNLDQLSNLSDEAAKAELMKLKGIGPWSAEIYLLEVLLRPDSWPRDDLALLTALRTVKHLPAIPSPQQGEQIAALWQPWRAVAARMLWSQYLTERGQFKRDGAIL